MIVDGLPDGGWHEPRDPYPYLTSTGPFKPFGVKARKGRSSRVS